MPYEHTRQIEERFQKTVALIRKKQMNTKRLAAELSISQPTVQRILFELRRRGYTIRSVRDDSGWYYELLNRPTSNSSL